MPGADERPIGFLALWHNKDLEYRAGPEEEQETGARIEAAFTAGRARGIRMFGRFGCRWSSAEQYFTFWLAPNLRALETTMNDLEEAGDFKFADSEHVIGLYQADAPAPDWDALAMACRPGPSDERPLGFCAFWRMTNAWYRASAEEQAANDRVVRQVFAQAQSWGVLMGGIYACRWCSRWDYFTFWVAPNLEALEATMAALERAGDFMFTDSRHVIGRLEPQFRFGTHLQPLPTPHVE